MQMTRHEVLGLSDEEVLALHKKAVGQAVLVGCVQDKEVYFGELLSMGPNASGHVDACLYGAIRVSTINSPDGLTFSEGIVDYDKTNPKQQMPVLLKFQNVNFVSSLTFAERKPEFNTVQIAEVETPTDKAGIYVAEVRIKINTSDIDASVKEIKERILTHPTVSGFQSWEQKMLGN